MKMTNLASVGLYVFTLHLTFQQELCNILFADHRF